MKKLVAQNNFYKTSLSTQLDLDLNKIIDLLKDHDKKTRDCLDKIFNQQTNKYHNKIGEKLYKSMQDLFLFAIAKEDLAKTEELLNQKENIDIDIDKIGEDGTSVLHLAAINVDYKMFELLLYHKADITIKDVNESNSLHYLVRYYSPINLSFEYIESYEKSIDMLLKNGIDINAKDNKGFTVAHYAVLKTTTKMLAFLLSNGADIYIVNNFGENPVELALYEDRLDAASLMLIYDTSIKYSYYENNIDLMQIEYLKSLNLEQYQHNTQDKSQRTNKISENLFIIIDIFSRKNLKVNEFCPNPPKQFEDDIYTSKLTKDQKKKFWFKQLEKCPNDKKFFFDVANSRYEKVEASLQKKLCDINSIRNKQKGVLHIATHNSNYKMVELLLKNKAYTELKDEEGHTPLHLAAISGDKNIIKLLLSYNANIFNPNNNGVIPIHLILQIYPQIITEEIILDYEFPSEEILNYIKYLKNLCEKIKIQQSLIPFSYGDQEIFTTIKLVNFLKDIVTIKNLIKDKNNNFTKKLKDALYPTLKTKDIEVCLDKLSKEFMIINKTISIDSNDLDLLVNKLIKIPTNLYAWFNDPKQNNLSISSQELGKQVKKQIKKNTTTLSQELEKNLGSKNIKFSTIEGKFKIYLDISSKSTGFFSQEVPYEFIQAFEVKFIEIVSKTLFQDDQINQMKCKILNSLKNFQPNEKLLEQIIISENLAELYVLLYGKYGNNIDKYFDPEKQIVSSSKKIKKYKEVLLNKVQNPLEPEEEYNMVNPQDYFDNDQENFEVDILAKEGS